MVWLLSDPEHGVVTHSPARNAAVTAAYAAWNVATFREVSWHAVVTA
jgi:hypothetical protein